MKCVFCNSELNNFDKICPYCGKPVQQDSGYSYGGNSIGNPYQSNPYGTQASQQAYGQTNQPTYGQTSQPTYGQTSQPTYGQTSQPTYGQTGQPTYGQTNQPTYGQTSQPTYGQTSQSSYNQGYQMPDTVKQKNYVPLILAGVGAVLFVVGCFTYGFISRAKEVYEERAEIAASSEAAAAEPDPAADYEAVTENATGRELILPGIQYGMTFSEFDDAMKENYPELEFRDDHEEPDPQTNEIKDYSFYATSGSQKISVYGVSDTAVYIVGYAKDGTVNYAKLYLGDVYATDDSDYLMYCKNSDAQEKENFGQLKASFDAVFGKGEKFEDSDAEMRSSYVYRPDDDTVVALGSRRSKNEESGKYLYDTVVEYYSFKDE